MVKATTKIMTRIVIVFPYGLSDFFSSSDTFSSRLVQLL
jgi:hypothetical protein